MRQTFLAVFQDKAGKQVSFERFNYKRLSTVRKALMQLWNNSLYRVCTKEAETISIYKTEYSTEGLEPVETITL